VGPFREAAETGQRLFLEKGIHFNRRGHALDAEVIREAYPKLFGHRAGAGDSASLPGVSSNHAGRESGPGKQNR
jgi:hypothetical protein